MKRIFLGAAVVVLLGLGIGAAIHFSKKEEKGNAAVERRLITTVMTQERGPRPTTTRLPVGQKQIEDPAQALELARSSLIRVEKEIAATQDETERLKLEKKKELVEKAIERLTSQ